MIVTENCRVKHYPDGTKQLCATVGEIRRPVPLSEKSDRTPEEQAERDADNLDRARRRARTAVRDLALCNEFEWFVTLTLDRRKIDRYDVKEVIRKGSQWLSNAVRRRGLRYVLIPEHHKDGAIHFHGFMSGDLGAVNSGHRDKQGHEIFNLAAWPLGHSAAIRPYGDYHKAVAYCCKYIGKQGEKIGGRWYYSGGDLQRPFVEYVGIAPETMVDLGAYEVKPKGTAWPYWLLELPGCAEYEQLVEKNSASVRAARGFGLLFEESLPDGWEPGDTEPWQPTPDEWREQIKMEDGKR